MKKEIQTVYDQAQEARYLYITGKIERNEAKRKVSPYIELFNN